MCKDNTFSKKIQKQKKKALKANIKLDTEDLYLPYTERELRSKKVVIKFEERIKLESKDKKEKTKKKEKKEKKA